MRRTGIRILGLSVLISMVSVAALLIYSVKLVGDLPTEGIYRLAFEWLAVWNAGTTGIALAFLGAALLVFSSNHNMFKVNISERVGIAGLVGGLTCLAGQLLDMTLGNPIIAGYIGGIDDDLFGAVGQAISLSGALIFITCLILLMRALYQKNIMDR